MKTKYFTRNDNKRMLYRSYNNQLDLYLYGWSKSETFNSVEDGLDGIKKSGTGNTRLIPISKKVAMAMEPKAF